MGRHEVRLVTGSLGEVRSVVGVEGWPGGAQDGGDMGVDSGWGLSKDRFLSTSIIDLLRHRQSCTGGSER